jgi:signal transduction histidine kinase
LGLEMLDEGRFITSEESDLLRIFSTDIAQLIEDSRLFEQSKALIVAEERNQLARDLHDSVTQVLFSASLVAELLPLRIRRDPESAMQSASELRRLTRSALAEMRTLLLELRPTAITKIPLGELLTQLTEAITSRTELPFQLYIDNLPPLPSDAQTTFYRIAQEALNNVVKHAEARQVIVSLSATPAIFAHSSDDWEGEIRLEVRDDGRGYTPGDQNMEHLGLGIMRERAAAIGAIFNIESQPGKGTAVTLIWHHGGKEHRDGKGNR